jgi:hypothetical protein
MASSKAKSTKSSAHEHGVSVKLHETTVNEWSEIKHFSPREFTCACKGYCEHPVVISLDLVRKLDAIRDRIGRHITIVSGTRCERHNRKVGAGSLSSHTPKQGVSHAADVRCPDSSFRFAFLEAALPLFNRIGVGKDFIHVDDDPDLPSRVVWVYGPDHRGNPLLSADGNQPATGPLS